MTTSTPANHWKLGLFVVFGVALGLAALVVFGARSMHKESVSYTFYFDESVQGLDIGSPAKFRGVTIGNVTTIDVAPDRRRVEVKSDMEIQELKRLGLAETHGMKVTLKVPPELRVQLASQGITGVKFLLIDFFVAKDYPPPELPFPTPENYIPTAPSTMNRLEAAVVQATDRLPEVLTNVLAITVRVQTMLDRFDVEALSSQGMETMKSTDRVMGSLQKTLADLNAGKISQRADVLLDNLNTTVTHLNALGARLNDEKGLVTSTQRTTNALGDLARNASGVSAELADTLRGVRDAADAIQRVADQLDRDPDMLLKGRAKAVKR